MYFSNKSYIWKYFILTNVLSLSVNVKIVILQKHFHLDHKIWKAILWDAECKEMLNWSRKWYPECYMMLLQLKCIINLKGKSLNHFEWDFSSVMSSHRRIPSPTQKFDIDINVLDFSFWWRAWISIHRGRPNVPWMKKNRDELFVSLGINFQSTWLQLVPTDHKFKHWKGNQKLFCE